MTVDTFEEEWDSLVGLYPHHTFAFDGSSGPFTRVARVHLQSSHRQASWGVYVVRQQATGQVLYVGKAGTVTSQGRFKRQDLVGRLTNVRGGRSIPAEVWFQILLQEKGPLLVQLVYLQPVPRSPAVVEAILLQAYLNEHGRLPYRNESF